MVPSKPSIALLSLKEKFKTSKQVQRALDFAVGLGPFACGQIPGLDNILAREIEVRAYVG